MSEKSELLLNELIAACIAFGRQVEPDWQVRIGKAQDKLKAYIDELEKAQCWIPVKEKPLEDGTFVVLLKNGEITKDWTFIDGGRYYWYNSGQGNVTHYIPEPKLPVKEGKNEN